MSETKRPGETEVKQNVVKPQGSAAATPKVDVKFQQSMSEMWGGIRRNFEPENSDQKAELDSFLTEQQDKFRRLGSERAVAQVHQFNEFEEYADGLPMLVDFMGRAKHGEREGYELYPEDMRKQAEATDQRNKQLFLDTARKLFPEVKPPESFSEANDEIQKISNMSEDFLEVQVARSALGLFKDASIGLKRRAEILDEIIEQIGDSQSSNANYGQIDSRDMPFGVSNKRQAIEAARLMYRLNAIRDQFQKELYGRKDVSAPDARKIDAIRDRVKGGAEGERAKMNVSAGTPKTERRGSETVAADKRESDEDNRFSEIKQAFLEDDKTQQKADETRQSWVFSHKTTLLRAIEKSTPQGLQPAKESVRLLRDLISKTEEIEGRIKGGQEKLSTNEQNALKIAQGNAELTRRTLQEIASKRIAEYLRPRLESAWTTEAENESQRIKASQQKVRGDKMSMVAKPSYEYAVTLFLNDLRRKATETKK